MCFTNDDRKGLYRLINPIPGKEWKMPPDPKDCRDSEKMYFTFLSQNFEIALRIMESYVRKYDIRFVLDYDDNKHLTFNSYAECHSDGSPVIITESKDGCDVAVPVVHKKGLFGRRTVKITGHYYKAVFSFKVKRFTGEYDLGVEVLEDLSSDEAYKWADYANNEYLKLFNNKT